MQKNLDLLHVVPVLEYRSKKTNSQVALMSHRPPSQATVPLLNSPWSSPFSRILEAVSRPEFAQDHESGLRSDRGPVVLCDFSKLRFWKSPYDFLNLYGRFCPYNPPYKPGKKISTPPFSRRWEHFSKIGHVGCNSITIPLTTNVADFWKMFSSSRKRGGADAF